MFLAPGSVGRIGDPHAPNQGGGVPNPRVDKTAGARTDKTAKGRTVKVTVYSLTPYLWQVA